MGGDVPRVRLSPHDPNAGGGLTNSRRGFRDGDFDGDLFNITLVCSLDWDFESFLNSVLHDGVISGDSDDGSGLASRRFDKDLDFLVRKSTTGGPDGGLNFCLLADPFWNERDRAYGNSATAAIRSGR